METALKAAEMTVDHEGLRWLVGKEISITAKGDVYGRAWDEAKYQSVLDKELEREYHNNLIILSIKEGATSVRDIAAKAGLAR